MEKGPYQAVDNLEVLEEAVNYNRYLVHLVMEASGGSGQALDFGAGTGTIASGVRARGLEIVCVEPDDQLRERLEERGFRAHPSIADVPDGSYTYLYSLNVLEHIENDARTLRDLHRVLVPGGRLLLYVPAFQLLYSSMDRKVGHFRRYRAGQLARLCVQAGFSVRRVHYVDSLGFLASLLYKWGGSRSGEISTWGLKAYDRLIFPVSRGLAGLGVSRLFGKNVLAVLEKS